MPANDVFELSVDAIYNTEGMTNVMHFQQVGADGTGDARDALLAIWLGTFDTSQRACQVDSVVHFQDRCRRVLPTQTQTIQVANSGVGTVVGNGLPTNQCAILRLYGALSGRKGVGHQKMYGVGVAFQLAGRLSLAWRDKVEAYAAPFPFNQTHIPTGYVFRAGVLGNDGVLRQVQGTDALPRVKTVYSRSSRVGS